MIMNIPMVCIGEKRMARNKYPEETMNQILKVAQKLFLEKGYEHTSIQDIINELGGLTKGAIYHHFKSKEDILIAVCENLYGGVEHYIKEIRDDKELTAVQKIKKMFRASIQDPIQPDMFSIAPNFLENSQFLALNLKSIMEEVAPLYVEPIIKQGIEEGSIHTEYPKQMAEALLLLTNLWLNPMVFVSTKEELLARCRFLQSMFLNMGVDIVDDILTEKLIEYQGLYEKNKS